MGVSGSGRPIFGRYELIRELAQGGMGRIYLARQSGIEGFSRLCVLKRIRTDVGDSDLAALLIDEARIAANLNHPNIATIYDFGRHDGELFLSMEYVAGPNLDDIVRRARAAGEALPRELGIHLVAEVARGLAYAHDARDAHGRELSVVHRDISPQNVLVSIHGEVKITDFGIARAAGKLHRSITGEVRGKIQYMSPEQLGGARVDRRADIFALGVMLWELTLGRPLYPGRTVDEVVANRLAARIPDPRSIDGDYPAPLAAAVMGALAELDRRTASAAELVSQLSQHASPVGRDQVGALVRRLFPEAGEPGLTGAAANRPQAPDTALAPGAHIGEFEIVGILGEGGTGVVYDAVNPVIGKRAAIKVLRASFAADQQAVSRFLDEARAVNAIDHPNIVDIFGFGSLPDGRPYCAMDRLDGETLGSAVRRGPIPPERALEILDSVAGALDAAHRRNIYHRDLKPDNVFLTASGSVKVLDFGLAKLENRSVAATQTGVAVGTPMYMSPEQAAGGAVDGRTDVYSFGVLAYRALTGRHPFAGERPVDALVARFAADPIPPSSAGAAPELDAPLLRCLARDPAARFATVGEACAALRQAHERSTRRRGGRAALLIAAAVIAAGAIAATAFALGRGGGEDPDDSAIAASPIDAGLPEPAVEVDGGPGIDLGPAEPTEPAEPAEPDAAPDPAPRRTRVDPVLAHRDALERKLIARIGPMLRKSCLERGLPRLQNRAEIFVTFPEVGVALARATSPRMWTICKMEPFSEPLVEAGDLRWKPTLVVRFEAPPARPGLNTIDASGFRGALKSFVDSECVGKIAGPSGPMSFDFETDVYGEIRSSRLGKPASRAFTQCVAKQVRALVSPNGNGKYRVQLDVAPSPPAPRQPRRPTPRR